MLSLIPALILAVLHGPAAFHSDAKFGWNATGFQAEEGAATANFDEGTSQGGAPTLAEGQRVADRFSWNEGNFLAIFSQLLSLLDVQAADNPPATVFLTKTQGTERIRSEHLRQPPGPPSCRSDLIRDGPLA